MFYVGLSIGIAVMVSLYVPMKTGRTFDTLKDVNPSTKVLASLLWPLIVVTVIAARIKSTLE